MADLKAAEVALGNQRNNATVRGSALGTLHQTSFRPSRNSFLLLY
jgi:hypothetical protein